MTTVATNAVSAAMAMIIHSRRWFLSQRKPRKIICTPPPVTSSSRGSRWARGRVPGRVAFGLTHHHHGCALLERDWAQDQHGGLTALRRGQQALFSAQ